MTDSYYERHVFFCQNLREDGRPSCAAYDSPEMRNHAKARLKEAGMHGRGKVRINQAGCLDRCEEGPIIVVYPEEVWYSYVDQQDIDEIIDEHLINGRVVERLKI